MNKIKWLGKVFASCVLIVATFQVTAKEFVASYDGFYDRLKVVSEGNFLFAQVNFYVTDIASGDVCTIDSGKIITETRELTLNYTSQAQLLLPVDKQLDSDKAVVVVTPKNSAHDCQLKLQIEANQITSMSLNKSTLFEVHQEFKQLLSDLSGFFVRTFMSFMLPEQQGVVIEFAQPITVDDPAFQCSGTICHVKVDDNWQDDQSVLTEEAQIVTIKPWIIK